MNGTGGRGERPGDPAAANRITPREQDMIGLIEPTYPRHDHAAVNAALLGAVALAFPDEDLVFAASAPHRRHVEQSRPLPPRATAVEIAVPPPGGVSARRFLAQWRAIRAVTTRGRLRALILLSSGAETFFAARAAAARFEDMTIFIVLHGNLNEAVGWRSRDPRHRLFDYRSGLAVARHPRIRMVALEEHIRVAALHLGLASASRWVTWPLPLNEDEIDDLAVPRPAGTALRIAFVGAATRGKGFDRYLDLVRTVRDRLPPGGGTGGYEFHFIGAPLEAFPEAAAAGIDMPAHPLDRDEFLRRLRAIDYVVLPYAQDKYALTASGSLLDCVAQTKPVLSLELPAVREMAARVGPIGFVCGSMDEMRDLLLSEPAVTAPDTYRGFQDNLRMLRTSRTSAGIAAVIRRDLGG